MIGTRLGHYRVLGPLGAGGMGVVYRAHDEVLQRDVAIKLVSPDAEGDKRTRVRLLREARMASALQHANICTVFEVGEEGAQTFIVMELVRGRSLAELLRSGPIEPGEVHRLGAQIAGALAHAHEHGVVHRDLKSANVMITDAGEVKVLDFGLARRHADASAAPTESMTATAGVAGTPAYMAPEALLGSEPDAASDIWALGVVLYEMASGELPFAGTTWFELSSNVLHAPLRPLPASVPAPLRALIERCLEKDRARRIARAADVRTALVSPSAGGLGLPAAAHSRPRLAMIGIAGALLAVMAVGLLLGRAGGWLHGSNGPIRSLAVLPLQNLTGDPQQEFFADGMTDELINTLARLAALRVISRTSVMQYRGTQKRVRDIAHELGVDAIVEGSVARGGDQVRISAMLIRGDNDQNLWANEFRRQSSDVLALQGDVATAVAQQIQVTLTPAEKVIVAQRRPVNPEAYEALLRGRQALNLQSAADIKRAVVYFEHAIQLDPSMAAAYAGLASCDYVLSDFEGNVAHYAKLGREAATKAIELDESLPEAHVALALVLSGWDYDWAAADREFARAIALNPSNSAAHLWSAFNLRCRGQVLRDREQVQLAGQLDPLNRFTAAQPGWVELCARRYAAAAALFESTLRADSSIVQAHEGLGLAYEQMHRYDDAIRELSHAAIIANASPFTGSLGHALALAGRTQEALAILDSLSHPRPGFVPGACDRALVLLALGRTREATRELRAAVDEHSPWIYTSRVDARFDPIRSTAEFQDALARMHLSDAEVRRLVESSERTLSLKDHAARAVPADDHRAPTGRPDRQDSHSRLVAIVAP